MGPDDLAGVKDLLDAAGARARTEEAIAQAARAVRDALGRVLDRPDGAERWAAITDALVTV